MDLMKSVVRHAPWALLCAGVAIAIGLPAGLIAGYYAGKLRRSPTGWSASS